MSADAYLVDLADAIHGARESVKTKTAVAGIETAVIAIGDVLFPHDDDMRERFVWACKGAPTLDRTPGQEGEGVESAHEPRRRQWPRWLRYEGLIRTA